MNTPHPYTPDRLLSTLARERNATRGISVAYDVPEWDARQHIRRFVETGGCERFLRGRTWPLISALRASSASVFVPPAGAEDGLVWAIGTGAPICAVGGPEVSDIALGRSAWWAESRLVANVVIDTTEDAIARVRRDHRLLYARDGETIEPTAVGLFYPGLHLWMADRTVCVLLDFDRVDIVFARHMLRRTKGLFDTYGLCVAVDRVADGIEIMRTVRLIDDRKPSGRTWWIRPVDPFPFLPGEGDIGRPGTVTVVNTHFEWGERNVHPVVSVEDVDDLLLSFFRGPSLSKRYEPHASALLGGAVTSRFFRPSPLREACRRAAHAGNLGGLEWLLWNHRRSDVLAVRCSRDGRNLELYRDDGEVRWYGDEPEDPASMVASFTMVVSNRLVPLCLPEATVAVGRQGVVPFRVECSGWPHRQATVVLPGACYEDVARTRGRVAVPAGAPEAVLVKRTSGVSVEETDDRKFLDFVSVVRRVL